MWRRTVSPSTPGTHVHAAATAGGGGNGTDGPLGASQWFSVGVEVCVRVNRVGMYVPFFTSYSYRGARTPDATLFDNLTESETLLTPSTKPSWPPLVLHVDDESHAHLDAAGITVARISAHVSELRQRCLDVACSQARLYGRPLSLDVRSAEGEWHMIVDASGIIKENGFTPRQKDAQ